MVNSLVLWLRDGGSRYGATNFFPILDAATFIFWDTLIIP